MKEGYQKPTGAFQGVNWREGDIPAAEPEILEFFKEVRVTLPYSRTVKYQSMSGLLLDQSADKPYRAALDTLTQAVMKG